MALKVLPFPAVEKSLGLAAVSLLERGDGAHPCWSPGQLDFFRILPIGLAEQILYGSGMLYPCRSPGQLVLNRFV